MTGLKVARYLIGIKLAGQAAIAQEDLDAPGVAQSILEVVPTGGPIVHPGGDPASGGIGGQPQYWSAWETVEATFVKADSARVPDNWKVSRAGVQRSIRGRPGMPPIRSTPS